MYLILNFMSYNFVWIKKKKKKISPLSTASHL